MRNIIQVLIIAMLVSLSFHTASEAQTGLCEELMILTGSELLPVFRDDSEVYQISSYDTTGGNDDGFSGKYSFLRKEGSSLVIADLKGPGVIHRIWTPTPSEDTIQFYFDGEAYPRINIRFIDLFSGKVYPFSRPVSGNEVGGYYCYVPIPYSESCKIKLKGGRMQFIQIQYRMFNESKQVTSFPAKPGQKEADALNLVLENWSYYGGKASLAQKPADAGIKKLTRNFSLDPGESIVLFRDRNGGRIAGFEIKPYSDLNTASKDLIIRASWDNDKVEAINCPLVDFFGYGFDKPSMQSVLAGVRDKVHYFNIPMPYDRKGTLELEYLKNESNKGKTISFTFTAYYNETKKGLDEGRLYAKWRREINPQQGKPYAILETEGHGHYVGTILKAQGLNPGITTFFEGDDQCFVDGELRLHGTGSEDYFNGGWYALPDRWDQAFSLPVHGALGYSVPLARTGGYRFYIGDKIPFRRSFSLTIEHGPEGNNVPVDYTSVAFFYCDRPPAENKMPPAGMLNTAPAPTLLEYWPDLFPVMAFSQGTRLARERWIDYKTRKNYDVITFSGKKDDLVKFELEVPEEGDYNILMSYFKGPGCGNFQVNQRQIPVNEMIKGYASENTFVEKELIGSLHIKEGTNTVTLVMKEDPRIMADKVIAFHRIYLEKK